MTEPILFRKNPKEIRDQLRAARGVAAEIQIKEAELVQLLKLIDGERMYLRLGFRTLSGFCNAGLRISEAQTRRLVLQVRRATPVLRRTRSPPKSEFGHVGP